MSLIAIGQILMELTNEINGINVKRLYNYDTEYSRRE